MGFSVDCHIHIISKSIWAEIPIILPSISYYSLGLVRQAWGGGGYWEGQAELQSPLD